tara:strand:+ start:164 stop:1018 length:855 start_codon:yes stop_codon:yes gene_type:complete
MQIKSEINLSDFQISNNKPLVIIGGINVIESRELAFDIALHFKETCEKYKMPFVFKASFDKANRSSFESFRGPGITKGLDILNDIKVKYKIPILTDVHTPDQVYLASKVCDIIQLPAFLARQTDLVEVMASTDCIINIKKSQFLSPSQIINVIKKFLEYGNNNLLVCERGTCFGYDNLVVDMLGFQVIKSQCNDVPLIFDVTHSLQYRDHSSLVSGGRRSQIFGLARAAISTRIAGLFIESHPNPIEALCDGASALPLNKLDDLLSQLSALDALVKGFPIIKID